MNFNPCPATGRALQGTDGFNGRILEVEEVCFAVALLVDRDFDSSCGVLWNGRCNALEYGRAVHLRNRRRRSVAEGMDGMGDSRSQLLRLGSEG